MCMFVPGVCVPVKSPERSDLDKQIPDFGPGFSSTLPACIYGQQNRKDLFSFRFAFYSVLFLTSRSVPEARPFGAAHEFSHGVPGLHAVIENLVNALADGHFHALALGD